MPTSPADRVPQATLAEDLARLASEPTSEKRVELLRRITDAYVEHADRCTPSEQYLFNEVVGKLIDRIADPDRVAAAGKLAQISRLPHGLAQKLASDGDINVARPIIRDYGALSERILIDVAKTGSQGHLSAIAGRPVVTPPVSDVVVVRGDSMTIRTLAANRGAQFSTFGMDKLVEKAGGDADLQELLVARTDLSLTAIGNLLPLISDELAERLRGVMSVDVTVVEEQLTAWVQDRQGSVARTEAYIDGIRKGDLNPNDIILELVAGKRLLDAATVLAAIMEIDRYHVFNMMTGGKIQSALLLRAVDLSWRVADAFIQLRIAKAGLYDYETPPQRRDYLAIDTVTAKRVVRFMKVRNAVKAG